MTDDDLINLAISKLIFDLNQNTDLPGAEPLTPSYFTYQSLLHINHSFGMATLILAADDEGGHSELFIRFTPKVMIDDTNPEVEIELMIHTFDTYHRVLAYMRDSCLCTCRCDDASCRDPQHLTCDWHRTCCPFED